MELIWFFKTINKYIASYKWQFILLFICLIGDLNPLQRSEKRKVTHRYVLLVNAVVSSEDETNRQMMQEFGKVLKPGGKLYGYFPTTLCFLEIAYFSRKHAHCITEGYIDVYGNKVWDADWQDAQIYYTPLRLHRIFKEAGLKRLSLEMEFLDFEPFVSMFKEMIEHDDPDIYLWHLLARYEKETLG